MKTEYRRKAHYYETDQMGIIHHSNYIRWFEEARVEFMDRMGFGYAQMEQSGVSSPVLGVCCDYKSMVRFDDRVVVTAWIKALTGAKMTVGYRVADEATGVLRAEGETRHAFLDREGRPVSLKRYPQIYSLFRRSMEDGE